MNELFQKKVYIVVLNWNSASDTIECIESILKLEYSNYQIIICDNGSTDNSLFAIKNWIRNYAVCNYIGLRYTEISKEESEINSIIYDSKIIIIKNNNNIGYAAGNNVALRYILKVYDFNYVWVLNNDTIVDKYSLSYLVSKMCFNPGIGLCGSTIYYLHDKNKIQACAGATFNKWTGNTNLISNLSDRSSTINELLVESKLDIVVGASIFISKSFLTEIGLIPEEYFLYCEDAHWSLSARGKFLLGYEMNSVVYHKEGGSSLNKNWLHKQSLLVSFYTSRNKLKLMRHFYPKRLFFARLTLLYSVACRVYRGQIRNAFIILFNIFGLDFLNQKFYKFK